MSEYVNAHMIRMIRVLLAGRKIFHCEHTDTGIRLNQKDISGLNKHLKSTKQFNGFNATDIKGVTVYWKDVSIPEHIISERPMILATEIASIEDYIIFQGCNNDGAICAALNTISESLDFGTNGHATITARSGLAMIRSEGLDLDFGAMMILNKVQYHQLLYSSNKCGTPEYATVRDILSGLDPIYTQIPAGEGLMVSKTPTKRNKITVHMDWRVEMVDISTNTHRIYASFETVFEDPQVMCRIENI